MMQQCVKRFINNNQDAALLLIDIGVWPFNDLIKEYPERVKNIGIFEPGTISLAAGLSLSGIIPTVYGISPFIVQRSLEQIKLDFAYQNTAGNFIVTGASYDFSTLGYSHYCPEDVATLQFIPGVEILTPGTPLQFKKLWNQCHNNGKPSYFRLTDYCNSYDCDIEYGKATIIKRGALATIVAIAETLDVVIKATKGLDVTILYYTTIMPFDKKTLKQELVGKKVFLCTPFYEGSISANITGSLKGVPFSFEESSVPLQILRNYGTKNDKDNYCGLTPNSIRKKIIKFIK